MSKFKKHIAQKVPLPKSDFKTGDLISGLKISGTKINLFSKYKDPTQETIRRRMLEIANFEKKLGIRFNGIILDPPTKRCDFVGISDNLEVNAELIAMQIKMLADNLNVSIDKLLGKILSSIYESEKYEDNSTD